MSLCLVQMVKDGDFYLNELYTVVKMDVHYFHHLIIYVDAV